MKWTKYCNLFSLLDSWGKMWIIRALPWVCSTELARCSLLSGCLVSGGRRAPSKVCYFGGFATGGIGANNESTSFITLFKT